MQNEVHMCLTWTSVLHLAPHTHTHTHTHTHVHLRYITGFSPAPPFSRGPVIFLFSGKLVCAHAQLCKVTSWWRVSSMCWKRACLCDQRFVSVWSGFHIGWRAVVFWRQRQNWTLNSMVEFLMSAPIRTALLPKGNPLSWGVAAALCQCRLPSCTGARARVPQWCRVVSAWLGVCRYRSGVLGDVIITCVAARDTVAVWSGFLQWACSVVAVSCCRQSLCEWCRVSRVSAWGSSRDCHARAQNQLRRHVKPWLHATQRLRWCIGHVFPRCLTWTGSSVTWFPREKRDPV